MIQIDQLTAKDVGRKVIYGRDDLPKQEGTLSSWNNTYIFVKFKGPNGEACQPADVSFVFEHCTIKDLGINITGEDAQQVIDPLNKYLHEFASTDGKCPQCGATLGGLLGSFAWGLAHGEGVCTGGLFSRKCGYPCRGYHQPLYEDGGPIFDRLVTHVLPYHPDNVTQPQEQT